MSSLEGFQGVALAAHYSATKAYVQALAEALHVEFAPFYVDVLASAPGPTHTGFAARVGQRMSAALQPGEVAESTLAALGRRGTVLPGMLTQVLSYSLALLPRWARVQIMGRVMDGMTKHRRNAQVIEPSSVQQPLGPAELRAQENTQRQQSKEAGVAHLPSQPLLMI